MWGWSVAAPGTRLSAGPDGHLCCMDLGRGRSVKEREWRRLSRKSGRLLRVLALSYTGKGQGEFLPVDWAPRQPCAYQEKGFGPEAVQWPWELGTGRLAGAAL